MNHSLDRVTPSPETSEQVEHKNTPESLIKKSLRAFKEFLLVGEEQKLEKEYHIEQEKALTSTVLASESLKQTIKKNTYASQSAPDNTYIGQTLAAKKLQNQLKDDNPVVNRVGRVANGLLSS